MTIELNAAQLSTHAQPGAQPMAVALDAKRAEPAPQLQALWARHADEVQAAQALRWRVFVQEMGARLKPPAGTPAGLDVDVFDAHCEHLLVRTVPSEHQAAQVVAPTGC